MRRRDFVQQAATITLGLGLGFDAIKKWYDQQDKSLYNQLATVSDEVSNQFAELLKWLRSTGWAAHLQKKLGVNLSLEGTALQRELVKELDSAKLTALRLNTAAGYDDFAGNKLIQPGFPAYSLLFHSIASPRVRPEGVTEYPGLLQIDTLENYIYALCDWNQLKSLYKISAQDELVCAVFAYEYRPAFKTPHQMHADLVYSRTGIARIGTEPANYDRINRCHTAEPADASKTKTAAVMPARYGLFLARKAKNDKISLVTTGLFKGDDIFDNRNDKNKFFLQPLRKIFDNDLLVNNASIVFDETHKTEKLRKLADKKGIVMWEGRKPEHRHSDSLLMREEKDRRIGSSFLVISMPAPLLRPARENGHVLFFQVPERTVRPYDNRYFTAFSTRAVQDVELLDGKHSITRGFNEYDDPRNEPHFVNITNIKNANDESFAPIPKTKDCEFEQFLNNGKYFAPLFEDSICDGSVFVKDTPLMIDNKQLKLLPAFSIVTAPDFFPQIDPLDLRAYDIAPGSNRDSNFYEGGVASLATARIKPNPKILKSENDNTRDTYLAVLSHVVKDQSGVPVDRIKVYKNPASDRGYLISSYLPDVASSVFAPGWDVTYCSPKDKDEYPDQKVDKNDIYVGTEGLGAPFIEDMKFCAALNGMWPATSPDSARTFQGSNEAAYRNPTSVPLLDTELGICATSPAGEAHESWGWDGEQGPYLELIDDTWYINFTDLGRADAVNNTLQGKVDLSKLRQLKSAELIARMDCLKRCIQTLPSKNFRCDFKSNVTGFTYLWLVSAEKVNWGKEDALALGIHPNLVGTDKKWITNKANAKVKGPGYLYVFVDSEPDKAFKDWMPDLKRRRLLCEDIYVCQVTNNPASLVKIAWTKIDGGSSVTWQTK